jgi:hypothetical protein
MKFNAPAAPLRNAEGAPAFRLTPELELYSAVATTLLSDVVYEKASDRLARIQNLLPTVGPEFAARLALYARTQLNLRTVPVVLAGELCKTNSGTDLVRKTVRAIVQRPDEITELLAYYSATNGRTGTKKLNRLSKQLQKGLSDAFNRFDEYQFAKYDRDGAVKLRDALFLVHPKPKDESQQAIFDKIASQTLATPYTWETELSALGQQYFANSTDKKAAFRNLWETLIDSGKLGYMALLRNLRNILEAGVSGPHVQTVCARLTDPVAVSRSRQLPFRFLAAYREIKAMHEEDSARGFRKWIASLRGIMPSGYTGLVLDALETALQQSVANLKGFGVDTRVVIAADVSGSMQQPVSAKSKILLYDIGLLLSMLLQSKCDQVYTGIFGDIWKLIAMPRSGVLANVDAFYKREGEVGYSTNGYLVLKDLADRNAVVNKVMIFTDCQLWDSNSGNSQAQNTLGYQWNRYKKLAPGARLYLFDLAGHGKTPVRVEPNEVMLIAGWSDKVFDMMEALEDGEAALAKIYQLPLE